MLYSELIRNHLEFRLFVPGCEDNSDSESTRHSTIAVVRRLFKMGLKSVERRLKTLRRLFHPLLVGTCAMLIYDDAYFPFFQFY